MFLYVYKNRRETKLAVSFRPTNGRKKLKTRPVIMTPSRTRTKMRRKFLACNIREGNAAKCRSENDI